MFNAQRLTLARKRRGMKKRELAERICYQIAPVKRQVIEFCAQDAADRDPREDVPG